MGVVENHARTTTRRMEEPYCSQRIGAAAKTLTDV
jgi:hypothetical protein